MKIEAKSYDPHQDAKFSILIPTWNNLDYLKLCVAGIRKHSDHQHQLIVHVNEGSDGSLEWVRGQEIDHTWSRENVGVCHALNAVAKLARTPHLCYINDDMYAFPGWDGFLWQEIISMPQDRWFLSATMIEPLETGNACALAPHDFGRDAERFDEQGLLECFSKMPKADWNGATWPPNVVPKRIWEAVGGYSEEFSPGMSSDPDFSMKLWQIGVRHFRGLGRSRVYHFQTKSTGKVKKNDGPGQFLRKWGITQGTFGKYYLRRGTEWKGELPPPGPALSLGLATVKGFFKRLLAGTGGA
jgi:glycosyltransferase involved in cell wall biosynthesis